MKGHRTVLWWRGYDDLKGVDGTPVNKGGVGCEGGSVHYCEGVESNVKGA